MESRETASGACGRFRHDRVPSCCPPIRGHIDTGNFCGVGGEGRGEGGKRGRIRGREGGREESGERGREGGRERERKRDRVSVNRSKDSDDE